MWKLIISGIQQLEFCYEFVWSVAVCILVSTMKPRKKQLLKTIKIYTKEPKQKETYLNPNKNEEDE